MKSYRLVPRKLVDETFRIWQMRVEGFSVYEIARSLGRSVPWVRRRLEAAEEMIREWSLGDEFEREALIARLEQVYQVAHRKAKEDPKWAEIALKYTNAIARLRGLDEPPPKADAAIKVLQAIAGSLEAFDRSRYQLEGAVDAEISDDEGKEAD